MAEPSKKAVELAANCALTNRGTDWGTVPLWSADLTKELNASIDFHAQDEETARAALPELIQAQIDRG